MFVLAVSTFSAILLLADLKKMIFGVWNVGGNINLKYVVSHLVCLVLFKKRIYLLAWNILIGYFKNKRHFLFRRYNIPER